MDFKNSPEIPRLKQQLLLYFFEKNYYYPDLKPYWDQIIKAIETNHQMNTILENIIHSPHFSKILNLDLKHFKSEAKIINHFFEYIYFTEKLFLKKNEGKYEK